MKIYPSYWAIGPDHKLRYDDGRVADGGVTHTFRHPEGFSPTVGLRGLHASNTVLGALASGFDFAQDLALYKVWVWGDVDFHGTRMAARHRKYIACVPACDVSHVVRRHALTYWAAEYSSVRKDRLYRYAHGWLEGTLPWHEFDRAYKRVPHPNFVYSDLHNGTTKDVLASVGVTTCLPPIAKELEAALG